MNSTDTSQTSPQPPAGPPRRLKKSADKKVAGVAAGIAEYFGIDPTIVRMILLASIFLGGFGLVAYVIAWVVLPSSDGASAPPGPSTWESNSSTVAALGLLVTAAIIAAATIDGPFGGGFWVPLLLIGGGAYLLLQSPDTSTSSDPNADHQPQANDTASRGGPAPLPPDDPGSALVLRDEAGAQATDSDATAVFTSPPPSVSSQQPSVPVGPAPPITAVTISAIAIIGAGGFLVHAAEWVDVNPTVVVGLCLGAIGLGLLAGAVWGGGGGLIPLGVMTTLILLVVSVASPAFEDGIGERDFRPATFAEVNDEYKHGIGELVVDLSEVEFPDGEHDIDIKLGIGEVRVVVPDNVTVVVDGSLKFGELDVFGRVQDGVTNDIFRINEVTESDATVRIDVESGAGHVQVRVKEGDGS